MFSSSRVNYHQNINTDVHVSVQNDSGYSYIEFKYVGNGKIEIQPNERVQINTFTYLELPKGKIGYLMDNPGLFNNKVRIENRLVSPKWNEIVKIYLIYNGCKTIEIYHGQVIARLVLVSIDAIHLHNSNIEDSFWKKCITKSNTYWLKAMLSAYCGGILAYIVGNAVKKYLSS